MINTTEELRNNTLLELRRGLITLAVLNQLRQEQYGYSLIKLLADQGFEIDQGTLYPLLRRLESQGLLQSNWRVEGDRPRRYYVISPQGEEILPQLKAEWRQLVQVMDVLLR
jgi:DNA-binding PadR family transcriptional regulator